MNIRIRAAAAIAAGVLALTACSSPNGGTSSAPAPSDSQSAATDGDLLSVANVVNGYLGDQGFFDDAERGIQELAAAGHKTTTLQADANNPSQWKANLESVSGNDWDLVVLGSAQMTDILSEALTKFPEQKFIFYDNVFEHENVASVIYKQNEGSFLAGVLAAQVTTNKADFPLSGEGKKVGVVGGMDIPVINDFVAGFTAGVEAVDPSIEVLTTYVGNFTDSQKGYDQAKAMFDDGADVVFQVAGGAGIGVLQAAKDAGRYGIGVDGNQNGLQPGHVLASMTKNIAHSLVLTIEAAQAGELEFGTTTPYGLANDGVRLDFADNGDIVPQSVIDEIEDYKQKVVSGELTVPTYNG